MEEMNDIEVCTVTDRQTDGQLDRDKHRHGLSDRGAELSGTIGVEMRLLKQTDDVK